MQKLRASVETDTQRIEAFGDGVFTIAIKLLIVEIRVPQVQAIAGATNTHSCLSLVRAVASYFAYILSFIRKQLGVGENPFQAEGDANP